jgi:hypothetical protein
MRDDRMRDDVPADDALEQQQAVDPSDDQDTPEAERDDTPVVPLPPAEPGVSALEADPVDVLEQRRDVPVTDDEP